MFLKNSQLLSTINKKISLKLMLIIALAISFTSLTKSEAKKTIQYEIYKLFECEIVNSDSLYTAEYHHTFGVLSAIDTSLYTSPLLFTKKRYAIKKALKNLINIRDGKVDTLNVEVKGSRGPIWNYLPYHYTVQIDFSTGLGTASKYEVNFSEIYGTSEHTTDLTLKNCKLHKDLWKLN